MRHVLWPQPLRIRLDFSEEYGPTHSGPGTRKHRRNETNRKTGTAVAGSQPGPARRRPVSLLSVRKQTMHSCSSVHPCIRSSVHQCVRASVHSYPPAFTVAGGEHWWTGGQAKWRSKRSPARTLVRVPFPPKVSCAKEIKTSDSRVHYYSRRVRLLFSPSLSHIRQTEQPCRPIPHGARGRRDA